MRRFNRTAIAILLASLIIPFGVVGAADVKHVSPTGNDGTGDGSIDFPWQTIQHAINSAADNDSILVHDGHYFERVNYYGKPVVVTSEFLFDQDSSHILNTIIDGDTLTLGYADTGSVVCFVNSEGPFSALIGLTIQNGNGTKATGYLTYYGGGILCESSEPAIRNCVIRDNYASERGGGLYTKSSSPLTPMITECAFYRNVAYNGGGLAAKGGEPWIENCLFEADSAGLGGAIYADVADGANIRHCRFLQNKAFVYSGAVHDAGSNLLIHGCLFEGNVGTYGGALVVSLSNTSISNCTFYDNVATSRGSCAYLSGMSAPTFYRCIFAFSPGPEPVHWHDDLDVPTVECSDVYGNAGGDWVDCLSGMGTINDNFSADPMFCDTAAGNFHLLSSSPCSESNSNCSFTVGAFDAGCLDFMCGDANASGSIDIDDIMYIIDYMFTGGPEPQPYESADVNCSVDIDIDDIMYIIDYMFTGGPLPCAGCM